MRAQARQPEAAQTRRNVTISQAFGLQLGPAGHERIDTMNAMIAVNAGFLIGLGLGLLVLL